MSIWRCPFCNGSFIGPDSLRQHLISGEDFPGIYEGKPMLYIVKRHGRIIPNHYLHKENAELAINNRGGTIIPLFALIGERKT